MFDKYIDYLRIYNSAGTVRFTQENKKSLLMDLGNVDHSLITREKIYSYIKQKQPINSNNTINKRISLLKRLYKFHEFDCPFHNVKKLREKFVTYGAVTQNSFEKLLEILEKLSLRDRVLIRLMIDTGARLSEIINIEIQNIDFATRSIFLLKTKTNQPRYVFFTNQSKKELDTLLQKKTSGKVFTNHKGDAPLTVTAVEQIFRRIRKKYGIEKLSPHRLRHSFSSSLYHKKADIIFISRLLGHSSVDTTKRYIHSDLVADLEKYDRFTIKKESQ